MSAVITLAEAKQAGLKTYFTGKPCKHGHVSPRMVANRNCVDCNKRDSMAWHEGNREVANARRMAWTGANRVRHSRNCVAYLQRHPERHCANQSRRRARMNGCEGSHSGTDVKRILAEQSGRCACCTIELNGTFHVDHIMPIILGGSNGPENLQILCPPCNLKKHAKHPIAWRQELGMLL